MSNTEDLLWRFMAAGNMLRRSIRLYRRNGSLRTCLLTAKRPLHRLRGDGAPMFIDIGVTRACQCRCVHCSAVAQACTKEEMTTDELKSAISQAVALGALEIIFSGGEPLMRPDLIEAVRFARNLGVLTRLNTNGLLLTREKILELRQAGVTQCAVSIDDAEPAVHDALRGLPGLHAAAVRGIQLLRECGVPCQILTYAARRNLLDGLRKIIALGRELGVMAVFIFFPMPVGRWNTRFEEVLCEEEKRRVRSLQDFSLTHVELPTRKSPCCALDGKLLYVAANGDVTPCPFVPFVLGNIRERSLADLWTRYRRSNHPVCLGDCPMNLPDARCALSESVDAVREVNAICKG
jgi:AdoMet-dependent heme synthase